MSEPEENSELEKKLTHATASGFQLLVYQSKVSRHDCISL
jgi:hypothetical protein